MTPLMEEYLDHVHRQTAFRSGKMEVGKVRSTLLREQGFNGEVMARHVYAEKRVATGNVELDYKWKHYKNTETGTIFLFSDVTLAVVDYTEWLMSRNESASQHGEAGQ
jgi:hypothetical protein